MGDFELRLANVLEFIDTSGSYGFDDSRIEELESIIEECNMKHGKESKNEVADSIYDTLYSMLKEVKPESGLLSELWEEEGEISEYTDLLVSNPMMSIETAKSYTCKELSDWVKILPEEAGYFASFKINGHGIRVVYDNGELVSATSRARHSAGRDLTRQAKILLGDYNDSLADFGIVELRGELCLSITKLGEARVFNPAIKSAFSAVSSLAKPSASDGEIKLLDFLCYGFITEGFSFQDREEEFQQIESCGFLTPQHLVIESLEKENLIGTIQAIIATFEEAYEEFGYFCDGVVIELNDRALFISMGSSDSHNNGNLALKVGVWKQDQYTGYVQKILWTKGKSKRSPVAIVADEPYMLMQDINGKFLNYDELGVLTAQGNKVRRVPLYEPKNILILDAYEGEPLSFRYGGEAGVVPCFPDGRLLTEDAVVDLLTEYNSTTLDPLWAGFEIEECSHEYVDDEVNEDE